jgi:hypothetical protein
VSAWQSCWHFWSEGQQSSTRSRRMLPMRWLTQPAELQAVVVVVVQQQQRLAPWWPACLGLVRPSDGAVIPGMQRA